MIRYGFYVFRMLGFFKYLFLINETFFFVRFIYHDGEKALYRPQNEEDLSQCLVLRDLFSWTNKS